MPTKLLIRACRSNHEQQPSTAGSGSSTVSQLLARFQEMVSFLWPNIPRSTDGFWIDHAVFLKPQLLFRLKYHKNLRMELGLELSLKKRRRGSMEKKNELAAITLHD